MKKFLSWILVFAIAFSCINMVSVSASGDVYLLFNPFDDGVVATATPVVTQNTGTNVNNSAKAVKVTHTAVSTVAKADFVFKAPFLTATDFGDTDSLDVIFVLKNPLDKELSISFKAQEEGTYRDNLYTTNEFDADRKPTGTKVAYKNSVIVPANGTGEFKLTFPKTGYFYHSNAVVGFASENYLDKLCLRVQCGAETLEVGSVLEIAIKDNNALNEKFVNAAAGVTWMGRTTTVEKIDAATMSAAMKDVLTATPTPTPTPTPAPTPTPSTPFTLVNGDVSIGNIGDKAIEGWLTWQGGTNEIVADPSDANNKVIKYVPTGMYSTTGFKASAVVYNDGGRYQGAGIAEYEITFRARLVNPVPEGADASKAGAFSVALCSEKIAHYDQNNTNTYSVQGGNAVLTTEWQNFKTTIKVGEKNYITWTDVAKDAENIFVRLDGSGSNRAFGYTGAYAPVGYYIDDITVGAIVTPTPVVTAPAATPEATAAPVGIKVATKTESTAWGYIASSTGVLAADSSFTGTKSLTYTIYNTSNFDVNVYFSMKVIHKKLDGGNIWARVATPGSVRVKAGAKEDVTFKFDAENGFVTLTNGGATAEYTLDELFLCFDYKFVDSNAAGDSFVIEANGNTDKLFAIASNNNSLVEKVTELPAYDYVTPTPVVTATPETTPTLPPTMPDGWAQENGNWVYYENGEKLTNTWKEDSVGWCYLRADGTMATNEWILDSVGWCYVGENGYCVTDTWKQDSVGWCYLDSEGRMATNTWILDSVGWCYVGSDGYCVTNSWMADSVGWVYLDSEGRMKTNAWVMDSVGWCYVGSDGYAMTNCWMADSIGWCYLDADGRMVTNGYVYDSNGKCWLDANGYWDGKYV